MDTPPIPPPTQPESSDDESLKKYIRTFAGDMEIVKKGGLPDLKPLESTSHLPPVKVKESVPPPPAKPAPELPEPPKRSGPPSVKPLAPARPLRPLPARAPEVKPSPLKTYTNDFLQRIKDTRASTATVLAVEEDAAGAPEKASKAPSRGNILPIIAGVLLLLLGGSGAYIAYTHYLAKTRPVTLAPSISAPIFVDEEEKISGETPDALVKAITQSMTHPLAQNAVRLLYTDLATTTGNSVFSSLQFPAPDVLLRNISAAQSMTGIVNISGTASPFFILSVTSYADTFAGMLSWEATMPSDLSVLFPPYLPTASTTAAIATTTPKIKTKVATSTPPALLPAAAFHDEVVSNHDARVYRDAAGQSILIYGYWNRTTLVIARDPAAFIEIFRRLATSHTQ